MTKHSSSFGTDILRFFLFSNLSGARVQFTKEFTNRLFVCCKNALKLLQHFSPINLKYEKKLHINLPKTEFYIKISDIHYEIDMSLLGCHSKLLWHDIYQQIVDILSAKNNKTGIIVCKDFHNIHSELLENFYSYMQDNNSLSVNIKYILVMDISVKKLTMVQ